ncbi:DUF4860 domain-containing protein [Desulfitobacterium sp. Sab5]|uniref:DUF4860 domain-containing protein n=1 Tax=Desulfitobacterium nosdiversum TaxID=3375356 RepID=UPI003CEC5AE0
MKLVQSRRKENEPVKERSVSRKNSRGFMLSELIAVLAIMGIIVGMLVSMMRTGGTIFRNAYDSVDAQNDARVAMSYLTVKIRQNDAHDGIDVDLASNSFPVLSIKDTQNTGLTYWIYFATGKLREQHAAAFNNTDLSSGTEISTIKDLEMKKTGAKIDLKVTSADNSVDLNQQVTLRSP